MIDRTIQSMKPNIYSLIIYLCLQIISFSEVVGQELKRFEQIISQGTSLHIFADQGEATIQVLVLGVSKSGVYEIGPDIRVDQLLFLSGGTEFGKKFRVTVRVYREEVIDRRLIYESPLEDMLLTPSQYPDLVGGDVLVVEVEERSRFDWRDAVRIIATVSSLVSLVRLFQEG